MSWARFTDVLRDYPLPEARVQLSQIQGYSTLIPCQPGKSR
jgi:hypothetical protein